MTGGRALVFTDVDETLITCKSMFDFLDFHLSEREGPAGAERAAAVLADITALAARGLPREQANRAYYQALRGRPAAEIAEAGARWFAVRSAGTGFFVEGTLAALREHRAAGAGIVLVSGSFPAVLEPIAAAVGADWLLCTRPEVCDELLTGAITGEPLIGEGKRRAVRELLLRFPDIDPADCYGYGDHVSDLPMLTEVGHPVIVGGSADLAGRLPGALRLPVG
jgi:HAD superfamily hydrolase (TIGR01490 family)